MCCCGKPVVNGQPGYSWNGEHFGVRQPDPPDIREGDILLFDEPGRCGGIDSHCHHFRVVQRGPWVVFLVRNGSGDTQFAEPTNADATKRALLQLDSDARYWLLCAMYHAVEKNVRSAVSVETGRWTSAAAEKRIKTRKRRNSTRCDVWIESK